MFALIRSHYGLDPEELSDVTIVKLWHEYMYVETRYKDILLNALRQVISEAFPSQT